MPDVNEAAETLVRCPRCQDNLGKSPDKLCSVCEGSGLVSGTKALSWNQQETRSLASNG